MVNDTNVREKCELIAAWLGNQDECLSAGLRSLSDAEKLYDKAMEGEWPEFVDDGWTEVQVISVIGYNPWKEPANVG